MLDQLDVKPTRAVHRQRGWWRWGWWRGWRCGHACNNPYMVLTGGCTVSAHHGTRRADHAGRCRGQDGNVSVSLFLDLDGALFLQLVYLLLQVSLSLNGLVLLLQQLPQREYLRAGVFVDFLCRSRTKTIQILR